MSCFSWAREAVTLQLQQTTDLYGYGSGRRLCPGIHLAERNLFLGIAKLLWAFDSASGKDEAGRTITPDTVEYNVPFVSFVVSYVPNVHG
jgi:cytochrome P450